MRISIRIVLFFLLFLVSACSSLEQKMENVEQSATLVLVNGMLIDGTGSDPIDNAVIIINRDRIVSIGSL